MTDSRPPIRTAGGPGRPDQDTTALPRVTADDSAWTPSRTVAPDSGEAGGRGFASKLGTFTPGGPDVAEGSPVAGASPVGRAKKPARSARGGKGGAGANRQPRKARLTLSHINVYSVFKFSCVLAIALFFVWLIMVGVLYGVLDLTGAIGQINKAAARVSGDDNPKDVVTGSIVFGGAIIIGAVYIVLFIAMSTIGSMVYNLCSDLVGGVELTLSERE